MKVDLLINNINVYGKISVIRELSCKKAKQFMPHLQKTRDTMNNTSLFSSLFITSILCLTGCSGTQNSGADIILTNGYVYTVDDNKSVVEGVAIKDGKIIALGSTADMLTYKGKNTIVNDLGGKMVMPGLHDMHIHALDIVKPDMCDLGSEVYSLTELVAPIKACLDHYQALKEETFLVLQWNPFEGNQPSEQLPNIRAALDAVSMDQPIILQGNDGHNGAANTAAFNSLVPAMTASTLKSVYKEYKGLVATNALGEPTGGLSEQARDLFTDNVISKKRGSNTPSKDIMPRVAKKLAKNGITSVQDPIVSDHVLNHYMWLENSGQMSFRVRTAFLADLEANLSDNETLDVDKVAQRALDEVISLRGKLIHSNYIQAVATKIFADGVMEGNPYAQPPTSPVAALIDGYRQPIFSINPETGNASIQSYVDLDSDVGKQVLKVPKAFDEAKTIATFKDDNGYYPSQCFKNYGTLNHNEGVIRSYVAKATKAGLHVHIHAVSDKAVQLTADVFEDNKETADALGLTQSIAHIQLARTEDIKRLSDLGAYVVFTYDWASPDPEYDMTVIPFVDNVKNDADLYNTEHYYYKNTYPFKTVINTGGTSVWGSDAPVGSRDPRPFESMHTALTREFGGIVLNPAERLDIHEIIASYTINSAHMMSHSDQLGSLIVGKTADLIVLDRNIVELANSAQPERIRDTVVETTIFNGHIVHQID